MIIKIFWKKILYEQIKYINYNSIMNQVNQLIYKRIKSENNNQESLADYNTIDTKFNEFCSEFTNKNWVQPVSLDQSKFIKRQAITRNSNAPRYICLPSP